MTWRPLHRFLLIATLGSALGVAVTRAAARLLPREVAPVSQADPGLPGRAAAAAQGALTLARLQLADALHAVAGNRYLLNGAEDLDRDAVTAALRTFCDSRRLADCAAFDGDLDALVEGELPLAASERRAAADLSPGDAAVRLVVDEGGTLALVGLAPLAGEGLGWVRLKLALGDDFAGSLETVVGAPVGLAVDGRLVSSGAGAGAGAGAGDEGGREAMAAALRPEAVPAAKAPVDKTADKSAAAAARASLEPLAGWTVEGGAPVAVVTLGPVDLGGPGWPSGLAVTLGGCASLLLTVFAGVSVLGRLSRQLGELGRTVEALAANPEGGMLPDPAAPGPVGLLGRQLGELVTRQREAVAKTVESVHDMERKLNRIGDLLAIDAGAFRLFVEKAAELQALCAQEIQALRQTDGQGTRGHKERLSTILGHVHTLKAHARLFNMQRIHQVAQVFEEHLAATLRRGEFDTATIDVLATHLAAMEKEATAYRDIRSRLLGDSGRNERLGQQLALRGQWLLSLVGRAFKLLEEPSPSPETIGRLHSEYENAVASVGGEDLAEYLVRYDGMLQEQARQQGKELEPLALTGNCRFLPHAVLRYLNDALLHSLRNALDHGIESPRTRTAAGKPAAGRIVVECNAVDGLCTVVIRDDGQGMVPANLRAKAIKAGIVGRGAAAALSDDQAFELVFTAGFTTASQVTDTSGRGIGMSVVRSVGRQLGGDVRLCSAAGLGTELHLHFPLSGSRFAARQAVFNLVSVLDDVGAALAALLPCTRIVVTAAPELARSALVFCDRSLFTLALKELLIAIGSSGPRPGVLEVQVGSVSVGAVGFETLAITLGATDGGGGPCSEAFAAIDLTPQGRLGELLMECGFYLPSGEAEGHRLEIHVPCGVGGLLAGQELAVLVLAGDPVKVGALLAALGHERFAGIALRVYTDVWEFIRAGAGRHGIVLMDELALADTVLPRQLAGHVDNVVIVAPVVAAMPLTAAFRLTPDPLIIEGVLDRGALAQALEFSLMRGLQRSRELQPGLPVIAA